MGCILIDTRFDGECVAAETGFTGYVGLKWATIKGHIELNARVQKGLNARWSWEKVND